jgi:hypothetical protein
MLIGFYLIEKKNIAALFSVYFLQYFCQLPTLSALKIACYFYIRVKWIIMADFEEIFPRKNVR